MWHTYGVGLGWGLVMAAEMVAFWAVVIYVVVRLMRGSSVAPRNLEPADAPLAVLTRRLAAGEIGVDEYEALRAVIAESRSPGSPAPAVRSARRT